MDGNLFEMSAHDYVFESPKTIFFYAEMMKRELLDFAAAEGITEEQVLKVQPTDWGTPERAQPWIDAVVALAGPQIFYATMYDGPDVVTLLVKAGTRKEARDKFLEAMKGRSVFLQPSYETVHRLVVTDKVLVLD